MSNFHLKLKGWRITPNAAAAVEYPALDGIDWKALWNEGKRDHGVTSSLYADALVEPYITWAGELSWRVTDTGKKAGLK